MSKQQLFTEEMGKNVFIFQPTTERDARFNANKIYPLRRQDVKKTIRKQRLAIK